jgi:hypothetical protein
MMTSFRRIPRKDIEFNSFITTIHKYLNAVSKGLAITNSERLNIPGALLADFNSKIPPWNSNWKLHENPNKVTPIVNRKKDTLRIALEPVIRDIQQKAEINDNLTEGDRKVLRIPKQKETRTPTLPPTMAPILVIDKRKHLYIVIRIYNPINPASMAKPGGVLFTEFYQYIGNDPPKMIQWLHTGGNGRYLFKISYSEYDLGKKAHIVARYRNAKGEFGPYSDPIEAVIS